MDEFRNNGIEELSIEKYSSRSAIRKLISEIPIENKNTTVNLTLKKIRKNIKKYKVIDYIYVVNSQNKLIGVVSFKNLFNYSQNTKLSKIMKKKLITVSPETDQEKVADLAVKHNIKAIPVVKNKKLIGVVPLENILPILNKALREDILHLAGIHKAHLKYENTLDVPIFLGILHRLPYLLIGLIGIIMAALFIDIFESTLKKYLILAFFIPAILYMSNALGTQHQTLFIRDLTILGKSLNIKNYFFRQMVLGSLLGLLISIIMFLVILFFWKEVFMALVISISMLATLIVTSFTSFLITIIINKFKLDPALGSGPIATIISDITSIILYFLLTYVFLGGL